MGIEMKQTNSSENVELTPEQKQAKALVRTLVTVLTKIEQGEKVNPETNLITIKPILEWDINAWKINNRPLGQVGDLGIILSTLDTYTKYLDDKEKEYVTALKYRAEHPYVLKPDII